MIFLKCKMRFIYVLMFVGFKKTFGFSRGKARGFHVEKHEELLFPVLCHEFQSQNCLLAVAQVILIINIANSLGCFNISFLWNNKRDDVATLL